MELRIKAVSPRVGTDFPFPRFATEGAAAMDLCACLDAPVVLPAGQRRMIPTGLAIALPSPVYVALVFARSGLGIKQGVCLANGVGVIDSDYRGEVRVVLVNHGAAAFSVARGQRIAQLLVQRVERVEWVAAEALADTDRSSGGFGSTGE